ncbi:hypothetical protein [Mucilaginibacter antarcticus]|uniref:Uncharacterized protein n=1 Tax=Mucilaginibacter antarcticus TaxID=1855725 RepID=A0ABW5XSG5_9SPHI
MNIKTANALFDEGIFSELYKAGFITTKVFVYREIYLWVQAQVKARGISKNQAVLEAEVKFDKDERTIWRALNSFTATDKTVSPMEANNFATFDICQSA